MYGHTRETRKGPVLAPGVRPNKSTELPSTVEYDVDVVGGCFGREPCLRALPVLSRRGRERRTMALCLMLALGFITEAHGNTNVRFVEARSGGELSFNCSTTLLHDGLTVYWSLPEPQEVLFLNHHPHRLTIDTLFKGRATAAGNIAMLSVTISKLTVNNSGLYWCKYSKYNKVNITFDETRGDSPVTMLHVTGKY
ncbi:hypothetical protein COCON_G00210400 [Conger conger]|uniref:Ig-like domain-containing protein n=1 Tax=Conger conger TaxID=82655 RepID=A0A9Q1D0L2_CONCO|nr:hypothetical protein COCON_G00210400 [Conger conger]